MQVAETMMPDVLYCATAYDVAKHADALLIVTEWNEFKQLDFDKIKRLMHLPIVLDGRNIYDPEDMAARGFIYRGVGRGMPHPARAANGTNGQVKPEVLEASL
jgi:UDPglucose 6-dehydrogenase